MGVPKVPDSTPFRFQGPPIPSKRTTESKPLPASRLNKDPLQHPVGSESFVASKDLSQTDSVERIKTASSQVLQTRPNIGTNAPAAKPSWERIIDPRLRDLVQHRQNVEEQLSLLTPRSEGPVSSSSTSEMPSNHEGYLEHILRIPEEHLSPKLQVLLSKYKPIRQQVASVEVKIGKTLKKFLETAVETPELKKTMDQIRSLATTIESYEQQILQGFTQELGLLERDREEISRRIEAWTPETVAPIRTSDSQFQKWLLDKMIYPAASIFSLKADHFSNLKAAYDLLSQGSLITDFTQDPLSTPSNALSVDGKPFAEEERSGYARRVKFYTEDHIQLDGCMIFSDPSKRDLQEKKMMVIAYGNGQPWELSYHHAKLMARKYDVNVMVYNPRGVLLSKGEMVSTEDAVKDCKAAIQYAQYHACPENPKRLGVFGQSIGGGVSARALQELKNEGKIGDSGIGLYVNNHSFRSLKYVAKGITKDLPGTGFLNSLSRKLLRKAKHDVLNAKKAIAQTKLADRVIVVTSQDDKIISGSAQLKHGLQQVQNTVNAIEYIDSGFGHNDIERYLLDHGDHLAVEDPRQALYQSILSWSRD